MYWKDIEISVKIFIFFCYLTDKSWPPAPKFSWQFVKDFVTPLPPTPQLHTYWTVPNTIIWRSKINDVQCCTHWCFFLWCFRKLSFRLYSLLHILHLNHSSSSSSSPSTWHFMCLRWLDLRVKVCLQILHWCGLPHSQICLTHAGLSESTLSQFSFVQGQLVIFSSLSRISSYG